jgi:hypothetical protein
MALPVSLVRHSLLLMLLAVLPLCATHPSPASHSPREFQFQKALHSRPSLSLSLVFPSHFLLYYSWFNCDFLSSVCASSPVR